MPSSTEDSRPRRDRGLFNYRPGRWALLSSLTAGGGWLVELCFSHDGADFSQGAFLNVFAGVGLAIVPLALGSMFSNRSQRAGDIAFSIAMIAQGIFLATMGIISSK
jgi:hypothetical protein